MRERTVKIGSAGKIFNLTGWKVGFVCAAPDDHAGARQGAPVPHLHDAAEPAGRRRLRPRQGRCAISRACARDLARSRDRFTAGLEDLGFAVIPSQGTYFLNIDIAPLGETDDVAFCRRLVTEHGVAAIPVSAFYAEGAVRNVVRFCFAKRDATLDAALERLAGVRRQGGLKSPGQTVRAPAPELRIVAPRKLLAFAPIRSADRRSPAPDDPCRPCLAGSRPRPRHRRRPRSSASSTSTTGPITSTRRCWRSSRRRPASRSSTTPTTTTRSSRRSCLPANPATTSSCRQGRSCSA